MVLHHYQFGPLNLAIRAKPRDPNLLGLQAALRGYGAQEPFAEPPGMTLTLSYCGIPAEGLTHHNLISQRMYGSLVVGTYRLQEASVAVVYTDLLEKSYVLFVCSEDFTKVQLAHAEIPARHSPLFDYLGDLMTVAANSLGANIIHSALIEYRGQAVILPAPSGTGKTTHAMLWQDAGLAEIINGDRALCWQEGAQWYAHGIPWHGTSGTYINKTLPLLCAVVLEQAAHNEITRLDTMAGIAHMLPNIRGGTWSPRTQEKLWGFLDRILSTCPVYLLRCRPDLDAVHTLKRELDYLLDGRAKADS
ncbi:MAG: hypothetical protein GX650_07095 [Clostridiales bacterium]|nr:hypothetical protein [Clostridiales bacterium]